MLIRTPDLAAPDTTPDGVPTPVTDHPPFQNRHSFRYWRTQGYVPSARLDGRMTWLAVRNLRHIQGGTVAACPSDMRSVINLERLHRAITSRSFFNPAPSDAGHTYYVSLIPSPVVDWFSRHPLSEVHDQIALYLALRWVLGDTPDDDELILRDTSYIYHDKIAEHVAVLRRDFPAFDHYNDDDFDDQVESYEQRLLERHTLQLPPWFSPKQVQRKFWALPHCEDGMPWLRPLNLADDFGIVSYGLTAADEEGLDAVISGEKAKVNCQKQQAPTRNHHSYSEDALERCESCPAAFEHLLYVRHARDAWATPWSGKSVGRVYLIQDAQGHVKIGWTDRDPTKRLSALQTGNADGLRLLGAVDGPRELEKRLHAKYADLKVRDVQTEWFRLSPADVLDILGLRQ